MIHFQAEEHNKMLLRLWCIHACMNELKYNNIFEPIPDKQIEEGNLFATKVVPTQ